MDAVTIIIIAFKNIWANKFRTFLTTLGIVLGVASLVAMAAVIKGMEHGMKESMIASGGLEKVRIDRERVPPYQSHLRDQAPGITIKDAYALQASAPLITVVSPYIIVNDGWRSRIRVTRVGKKARVSEVAGVWPTVLEMKLLEIAHGRFFSELDEERASAVCVIGTGIRDQLFGSPEETGEEIIPIGRTLNVGDQAFTIIGMFKHYESQAAKKQREWKKKQQASRTGDVKRRRGWGGASWHDPFWRKNNYIYMPLNSAWLRFRAAANQDGSPDPRLRHIEIKVASMDLLEPALQQARNVLLTVHNGIEDFEFETEENSIDDVKKQIRNAKISQGIIAALSLIVGGIGIMNIMLASINERVREIGTCKAIGATSENIFSQIVVESVAVAILGAAVGLLTSLGLVDLIDLLSPTQNSPVITANPMVFAVAFSGLVGITAGLYPAIKAARLDPIAALRYE